MTALEKKLRKKIARQLRAEAAFVWNDEESIQRRVADAIADWIEDGRPDASMFGCEYKTRRPAATEGKQ